jgi:hypothetical protein
MALQMRGAPKRNPKPPGAPGRGYVRQACRPIRIVRKLDRTENAYPHSQRLLTL